MALPSFPDGPAEANWRIEVATPPSFAGTGDLATGSAIVANFAATLRGTPIVPLPGQLVSGPGVPPDAAVAAVPVPSASQFSLTLPATATGPGSTLQVGSEPIDVPFAKQWGRIQYSVDDNIVAKLITMTRRYVEGPGAKQALLLQSRTLYMPTFPWGGAYGLVARGFGLNPWWFPSAQGVIVLPYPPLISVDAIAYTDTGGNLVTMDPASYAFTPNATPGRLQPNWGTVWPIARPQIDSVRITFRCGFGPDPSDVPAEYGFAIAELLGAKYRNRESDAEYELTVTNTFNRVMNTMDYGYYS